MIRATDFVLPCIEVVDNRQQGRGPNLLVDSIADAASCGLVVLGGCPVRLTDVDIRRIGASLAINGIIEESGVASAVMGNPINAVAWLANKLHEFGVATEAGHVILSGSFIKAVPFEAATPSSPSSTASARSRSSPSDPPTWAGFVSGPGYIVGIRDGSRPVCLLARFPPRCRLSLSVNRRRRRGSRTSRRNPPATAWVCRAGRESGSGKCSSQGPLINSRKARSGT